MDWFSGSHLSFRVGLIVYVDHEAGILYWSWGDEIRPLKIDKMTSMELRAFFDKTNKLDAMDYGDDEFAVDD